MVYMSKAKRKRIMRQRLLGLAIAVAALVGILLLIWQIGLGAAMAKVDGVSVRSGMVKGVESYLEYIQMGSFSSDWQADLEGEDKIQALESAIVQRNSLVQSVFIPAEVLKKHFKAEDRAFPDEDEEGLVQYYIDSIFSDPDAAAELRAHGVKKAHVRYYYEYSVAMSAFQDEIAEKFPVTDEEAQEYYDEHQSEYITPFSMQASHILIQDPEHTAEKRAEIESILEKLDEGGDFAELAMEYSEDGSAESGGDLGSFGLGAMVAPFEEACLALEPGEISGIVETEFGFHIIKMVEKTEESLSTLEDVRDSIDYYISYERTTDELDALTEAANIVYYGLIAPSTGKPPTSLAELDEARGLETPEEDDEGLDYDIDYGDDWDEEGYDDWDWDEEDYDDWDDGEDAYLDLDDEEGGIYDDEDADGEEEDGTEGTAGGN